MGKISHLQVSAKLVACHFYLMEVAKSITPCRKRGGVGIQDIADFIKNKRGMQENKEIIMQSSSDLANDYDTKEREFSELLKVQQSVEQEILFIRRDILDLQRKKADLEITKCKAVHNVRQCKIELDLLKSAYFQSKASGI